jgi:hypothetical protein
MPLMDMMKHYLKNHCTELCRSWKDCLAEAGYVSKSRCSVERLSETWRIDVKDEKSGGFHRSKPTAAANQPGDGTRKKGSRKFNFLADSEELLERHLFRGAESCPLTGDTLTM